MYYAGADDQKLSTTLVDTCEKRILVYDYREEDYFLEFINAWNSITTPIYTVLLGEEIYLIPSSTYIVCGDAGGSTDIIIFDEIIGREIPILTVMNDCRKLEWHIPRILAVDNSGKLLYPMINCLVPMLSNIGQSMVITGGSERLGGKVMDSSEFIV